MSTCIFCHLIKEEQILYQTKHFKVVFDIDPIQTGHLLLITKEHYYSLTELPHHLLYELIELEVFLTKQLEETLPISGVTIASNDKDLMDTGTHFHIHLIPRLQDDGFWETLSIQQMKWDLTSFLSRLQ